MQAHCPCLSIQGETTRPDPLGHAKPLGRNVTPGPVAAQNSIHSLNDRPPMSLLKDDELMWHELESDKTGSIGRLIHRGITSFAIEEGHLVPLLVQ